MRERIRSVFLWYIRAAGNEKLSFKKGLWEAVEEEEKEQCSREEGSMIGVRKIQGEGEKVRKRM